MPITSAYARPFLDRRAISGAGHRVTVISVSAVSEDRMDAAIQQTAWLLRERHKIQYQEDDFTLTSRKDILAVTSRKDILAVMNQVTDILTGVLASIAALSLLVGGIGIMNIILVSVTERTREFGNSKGLGAKRRDILLQFLIEAMVVSVIGGLVGILFGVGVASVVKTTGVLVTLVSPQAVILALGFSVAVGLFFGIYPARRAAMLNPIDALRYE